MRDMVHKPKKLQLLPNGVECIGYEDEADPRIYEDDMQIELKSGYVGRVAQEDVGSKLDRIVSATPDHVVIGSEAMRVDPRAVWDSSNTLKPTGPQAPAGFEAKSTLVSAVQYTAPSKSMVTHKSDAELRQVFEDADTDKGGSLDRDEIAELSVKLGKRLTRKELDEAMADMDEDQSNEVDFAEFSEWWKDSVKKVELGNVVGVVQAINKIDGPSFDKKDIDQLARFLGEISYMINDIAEKTNLAYAADDYEQIDQFQDEASRNRLAKLKSFSSGQATRSLSARNLGDSPARSPRLRTPTGSLGISPLSDFSLDSLQLAGPSRVLAGLSLPSVEELQQWSFPVLNYSMEQLVGCVVLVFHERGFMQVRSPKLTVAFSQSSYISMTYRVVGNSAASSRRRSCRPSRPKSSLNTTRSPTTTCGTASVSSKAATGL